MWTFSKARVTGVPIFSPDFNSKSQVAQLQADARMWSQHWADILAFSPVTPGQPVIFVQMKNEVADEAAVTIGRRRRAASKMKFHGISHTNDRLVALPREVKNMIREYLEWRRHNGYGKMTRRWGK